MTLLEEDCVGFILNKCFIEDVRAEDNLTE